MPERSHAKTHSKRKTTLKRRRRLAEEAGLRLPGNAAPVADAVQKSRLDPQALSTHRLLQLQLEVGNRAVGGLLHTGAETIVQRQDDQPLSATQVARALWFYRERSAQYTTEIIRQIQAGVGVAETGVVDETMVQAVARYQQANSPLAVDGMAGPRTLPALFPSGLADQEAIEAYAAAARTVIEGDWASKTVEERADAILEKVNERLQEAGVPQVGKVIQALGANEYGRFAFSLWSIRVNQDLLASDALTEAQAADLADTMYHEARHAEQWYRMAQLLAGQGRTAGQIATQMGIPARIAAEAAANPIEPGSMEALIVDGWFQSVYGTGSAHRRHVLGPSGTYEQYRNLPEESDAWRVGTSVKDAYAAGAAREAGTGE